MTTLLKGVEHRESLLRQVEVEFLYDTYARKEPDCPFGNPPAPHALRFYPTGTHGLYWIRILAARHRARVETTVLKVGPPAGNVSPGVGPQQRLTTPDGVEFDSDSVRSLCVYDGSRAFLYDIPLEVVKVVPQHWSGAPANFHMVRRALGLGLLGHRLSECLQIARSLCEDGIQIEQAAVDGRREFQVTAACRRKKPDGGYTEHAREAYIVPGWGYAVRRYEERDMIHPSGWGRGHLLECSGFTKISPEIWMPSEVIEEEFKYSKDQDDPLAYTRKTTITRIRINHGIPDYPLTFHAPLNVQIQDMTGTVPDQVIGSVSRRRVRSAIQDAEDAEPPRIARHLNVPTAQP